MQIDPHTEIKKIQSKPPIHRAVKWMLVGFGAFFLIAVLLAAFNMEVINKEIDTETKVIEGPRAEGSAGVATGQAISVTFANGNFELTPTEGSNFLWSCSGFETKQAKAETIDQTLTFDLKAVPGANCELSIPKGSRASITGASGNIDVIEPNFHVSAPLDNGNIEFESDDSSHYRFDVKAENGTAGSFQSNESPNSEVFEIKLFVKNGNIEN